MLPLPIEIQVKVSFICEVWDVGYFRLYNDCAVGWMIWASSSGR